MYPIIKRTVSSTKNGAYKKRYRSVDFEMLPWVQWLDVGEISIKLKRAFWRNNHHGVYDAEPLTEEQRRIFRYLYPILLQEINTKKPSKLLHFLIGRGVLFWQDVVIIQHQRQTDMERNRYLQTRSSYIARNGCPLHWCSLTCSPFLRILMSRGQEAYYSLIDGLRSRYGAWQGYLADLLAAKCDLTTVRGMLLFHTDAPGTLCLSIVATTGASESFCFASCRHQLLPGRKNESEQSVTIHRTQIWWTEWLGS